MDDVVNAYILAPDDLHKAATSGDYYCVRLPDRGADVLFRDGRHNYFVAYLRRVFAWGGFPGWEYHSGPPTQLIEELAQGLLPI